MNEINLLKDYEESFSSLNKSGIINGYEYVLKKFCQEGLPGNDHFDLCATYLTEFENKIKNKILKNKSLKELINDEKKIAESKKAKFEKQKPITDTKLQRQTIALKSKKLLVSNFNIMIENKNLNKEIDIKNSLEKPIFQIAKQENFDIEKIKIASENYNFLIKKNEMESVKILEEKKNEIFNKNDNDLLINLIPSKPEKKDDNMNLSNVYLNSESFEIQIDLLNHVTNSGGMEKLNFQINKKI